jgi:hypothetical protein
MTTEDLLRPLQAPEARHHDLVAAWRGASEDAGLAYADWRDAARERRPEAFWVYRAAADREGAAIDALWLRTRTAAAA